MSRCKGIGVDDSLLFFFLLLILIFCSPGSFGCDDDCYNICEPRPHC
ncbi:MAG: hypothetical protein PHH48_06705 [Eubacteriales bacterium]|nr:hypothetical protein [Eubacteriales bacterium]